MIKIATKNIVGVSLLCAMSSVSADIVYQSDDRYIDHGIGGTFTPTTPYADFDVEWWAFEAGAFQNSSMNANSMSGSGWTYAGFDAFDYGADATSVFSVSFGVDELSDFSFSGYLDTGFYGGEMYVTLTENGTEIFTFDNYDFTSTGINPFYFDGQFLVGNEYQLILSSYADNTDYYNERWSFELNTVSAVPVPAAIWLFGSGLLTLIGFSRRKI